MCSIRTDLLKQENEKIYRKNLFQFQNIYILSNGFPHLFGATFFTKDDGNFTADLQNVSFLSLDESIGKIEVE
jgi:hypothetical protein